jgi:hypothetical protein
MGRSSRVGLAVAGAVYLLLCLAAGLSWEHEHDEGVTFDQAVGSLQIPSAPAEPMTIEAAYAQLDAQPQHGPRAVIAALMAKGGMHPPAYYLAMNAWARIAGTTHLALLAPAYLVGLSSLFALALLARRLIPEDPSALAAVWLLAVSPWFIGFSSYARPYAIALGISLWAALAAFACAGPAPTWRSRAAFALLSVLGLYTLYHYAFVLVWHGAFLAWMAWRRPAHERMRELARLAALALLIALAFAPWATSLAAHVDVTGSGPWYFSGFFPLSEWPRRSLQTFEFFLLAEPRPLVKLRQLWPSLGLTSLVAFWSVLIALVGATTLLALRSFRPAGLRNLDPSARAFWLSAPLLPIGIALADRWQDTHTLFLTKTSFALVPLFVLATARAWSSLSRPALRRTGLAAYLLLFTLASLFNALASWRLDTPFEQTARRLAESDTPKRWIVLSSTRRGYATPLLLTLRDAGVQGRIMRASASQLGALLEHAQADPDVEELVLVGLDVFYEPPECWVPPSLARVVARARRDGWQVAGDAEPGPGKRLVVLPALPSKYFSM